MTEWCEKIVILIKTCQNCYSSYMSCMSCFSEDIVVRDLNLQGFSLMEMSFSLSSLVNFSLFAHTPLIHMCKIVVQAFVKISSGVDRYNVPHEDVGSYIKCVCFLMLLNTSYIVSSSIVNFLRSLCKWVESVLLRGAGCRKG